MSRSFFLIGIITVCLLSCSKTVFEQAGASDVPAGEASDCYLTISLSLPKSSQTRSQTDNQGGTGSTENGMDTECKVTDAWVILGELAAGQQAPIRISQKYYIDKFKYAGNPAQWSTTILCPPGHYRIAIIVNPGKNITYSTLPQTNWDALARFILKYKDYNELQQLWSNDNFLMTNAFRGRLDENDVNLVSGQHIYKDLYVQRACARFDYIVNRQDNVYEINCNIDAVPSKLPITLTEAGLMNVSNNFNLFKMIVADNQPGRVPDFYQYETNENYVYDSDWTEKRIFQTPVFEDWRLKEFFFFPSERKVADTTPPAQISYSTLPKVYNQFGTTLSYASENTLPGVMAQINKLSTGVVFKGSFRLDSHPQASTLWYRATKETNELYTSLDRLKQTLLEEGYIIPFQPTDADWAKLGVVRFARQSDGSFPVWYTYWNRHNDNLNPKEMGIMEFAVVRNNIYKLEVRSISSLGLPKSPDDPANPWKPEGNTPDEDLPQMDVTVEVCDWVERELVHEI